MSSPPRVTSRVSSSSSRSSKLSRLVSGCDSAGAAQDRADARDELLEAERLGDVVVAAHRQAAHLVLGRVAGGEEDDRHLARARRSGAGDLEALHVGEHHVEDQQVGLEASTTASSALRPSPADSTVKPWKRSAIEMTSTMFGSSSTTRTRWVSGGCGGAHHALSVGSATWEVPGRRPGTSCESGVRLMRARLTPVAARPPAVPRRRGAGRRTSCV